MYSDDKNDFLRNTAIGAVAAAPIIGGPLAYLLDKKLPEEINLRYISFIEELEREMTEIIAGMKLHSFIPCLSKFLTRLFATTLKRKK